MVSELESRRHVVGQRSSPHFTVFGAAAACARPTSRPTLDPQPPSPHMRRSIRQSVVQHAEQSSGPPEIRRDPPSLGAEVDGRRPNLVSLTKLHGDHR